MEVFEIYTLGAGYYLEKVFNALRLILNGDFASVMKVAAIGAIVILALRAGINNDFKGAVKWFLGVTILVALFLNTRATVEIFDTLPNSYGQESIRRVENVPWGLAFIGSITSKIGNSITEKFDKSLSGVFNNSEYQKTGILFGSKIVEDIGKIRVEDPQLKQFILQFYKKCIVPDLNMGLNRVNGYTVKDLVSSDNILEFLSERSSKARLINRPGGMNLFDISKDNYSYASSQATANSYISCNNAANYIKKAMEYEVNSRMSILSNSFLRYFQPNEQLANSSEIFKSVLSGSYGIFIKSLSKDAKDILLQNMAINGLGDSVDSRIYGKVVTESVTKSAYYSVSQMAQKFVPILRAVLECLFYGVFPVVLILMVTPIGLEVLKNYAFGFVYLQLWQPMYAILFCIAASWGEHYASNINGITFGSHAQISRINEEISSVAGFMLTLVPVLSLFITKGMVASIGNLASSITYIPQNAAVQNAEAAVKGNYQLGTTSIDSHSSNISSSNKHDDNYTWMSGMKSFGMSSGAQERLLNDGRTVIDSTGAVSNLAGLANINWNKAIGSRYDQAINENVNIAKRYASNAIDSSTSGYNKLLGFDQNFSKGSSAYESWSKNLSSDERKTVDEVRDFVEKLAQDNNINSQDALRLAVQANASFGMGVGFGSINAKLGLSASEEGSTVSIKGEAYNESLQGAQNERFAENLSKLENYANNSSIQENSSVNNNMLKSVRSDFSKAKTASFEASKSFEEVHNLQDNKAKFESNSTAIIQDLSSKFADEKIKKVGSGKFEKTVREDAYETNQQLNDFLTRHISSNYGAVTKELAKAKANTLSYKDTLRNDHQGNLKNIDQETVSNKAKFNQDMPKNYKEEVEGSIEDKANLKQEVTEKYKENENNINDKSRKITNKERELKGKVEERTARSASGNLSSHWTSDDRK